MPFGLQNSVIALTPTGRIDSAFVDGNDGSGVTPSWTAGQPNLATLQVGVPLSLDIVAAGFFTDPGSPSSELGFNFVSGQPAGDAGFSFTGTVLSNNCTVATSGAFRLVAVRNGISVLSPVISFAISAPFSVDTIAPSIPTGITAVPGTAVNTILVAFDPPSDVAPLGVSASGSAHVELVSSGTVVLSPPSPIVVPSNSLRSITSINIGNITSPQTPSLSQAGKQWTLSVAGTGIAATAAEQCLFAHFGPFTGAQRMVALLDSYVQSGASTSLAGIMLHETGTAGDKFVAIGLRASNGTTGLYVITRTTAGGTSSQVLTALTDTNGHAITGPVYVKVERAADLKTLTVSYSLSQIGWTVIGTTVNTMIASPLYGVFATSQAAGTQINAIVEEVSITNSGTVTATIASSTPVTIQARSIDAGGNVSALSASIVGVPKTSTGLTMKFFPGWYMGSDAVLNNGRAWTDTHFTQELSDMRSSPSSVIGYRAFITLAHIDPNNANGVQANYNWADIDGMKANIGGKKFVIQFNMGVFNNPTPARPANNEFNTVPQYILQNTVTYGAGIPAGDPNGQGGYYEQNTGGYCANIINANVRAKCIQVIQAVAARYDNDSQLAFFGICEDSNMIPLASTGLGGQFRAAWMAIYQAARDAFQKTPVYAQATFQVTGQESQTVCADMVSRGVLQGTADTYGKTYYGSPPFSGLSWGLCCFTGTTFSVNSVPVTGIVDNRSSSGAAVDYQDSTPDLIRSTSITDLANGLNQVIQASVCFFSHVSGKTGNQAYANWSSAVTQFAPNPITKVAYPSNLP